MSIRSSGNRDTVVVHLDAADLGSDRQVGVLARARAASGPAIALGYADTWLADVGTFAIDPELPLYAGDHYARGGALPGIFTDAAPDRWGRVLLERQEAHLARDEGRSRRRLDDWDFLVRVPDAVRMGALRLAAPDGRFLDDRPMEVPPTTQLRTLEEAAREFERGARDDAAERRFIAVLLAPGSSLGGGRPKASFTGEDGALWIAKFPSRDDRHDVGAWEYLLHELASECGIVVPEATLIRLGGDHRTYCARRFDRDGATRRLFASAMTLAGKRDGEDASYLDIAQAITQHGDPTAVEADLEQLFRRAVFNVLVGDRDDHLRNHGFLRAPTGWRLAPAFDLNPASDKREHTLALDDAIREPDVAVVRGTASLYQLSDAQADVIMGEVRAGLAIWRIAARRLDIPADEIALIALAFEAHTAN